MRERGDNDKSRAVLIFENYLQSPKTKQQYLFLVTKFTNHYKLKSVDSILKLSKSDLKEKIEDYVILFKDKGKSSNYLRVILFAIQSFCESNDFEGINWKKIRRLLGKKQKPKKSRPYTTEEIKLMLGVTKELRNKSVILFLAASGVRRGALPELKIRNLKEMPNDCLAITVYEGSNEEYVTFINKEAKESLTRYFEVRKKHGEILEPDHPVFRTKYKLGIEKTKPISEKVVSNLVHRAKGNAGINLEDSPNLLCHAFRRRFNTVLKLNHHANTPLIERLMGHDMKLDNSYFQPTIDQLFEEYQKGMADLTIDDKTRVIEENKMLQAENDELELKNKRIDDLEKRFEKELSEVARIEKMKQEIIQELSDPNRIPPKSLSEATERIKSQWKNKKE